MSLWKCPLHLTSLLWSLSIEVMHHKLLPSFASSPSKQILKIAAWDRVRISTATRLSHLSVWLCMLHSMCGSKMILINCWTHKGCTSHCKLITASQKMSQNCRTYNYLYRAHILHSNVFGWCATIWMRPIFKQRCNDNGKEMLKNITYKA